MTNTKAVTARKSTHNHTTWFAYAHSLKAKAILAAFADAAENGQPFQLAKAELECMLSDFVAWTDPSHPKHADVIGQYGRGDSAKTTRGEFAAAALRFAQADPIGLSQAIINRQQSKLSSTLGVGSLVNCNSAIGALSWLTDASAADLDVTLTDVYRAGRPIVSGGSRTTEDGRYVADAHSQYVGRRKSTFRKWAESIGAPGLADVTDADVKERAQAIADGSAPIIHVADFL